VSQSSVTLAQMASLGSMCTATGARGVVGGARRPRAVAAPPEAAAAAAGGAGCRRGVVEAGVVHRGGAARRRGLTRQRAAAGAAEGRGVPRRGAASFGLATSAAVGVSCRAAGSTPSVGDGDVSEAAAAPGAAAAAAAAGKPPIPPLPYTGGADTRRLPTYHLHEDATDFDVIVVGAGHAGCEVGPRQILLATS